MIYTTAGTPLGEALVLLRLSAKARPNTIGPGTPRAVVIGRPGYPRPVLDSAGRVVRRRDHGVVMLQRGADPYVARSLRRGYSKHRNGAPAKSQHARPTELERREAA